MNRRGSDRPNISGALGQGQTLCHVQSRALMLTPSGPPPAVPSHPNRNLDGGWEEMAWKPWEDEARMPASRLLGVLFLPLSLCFVVKHK